MSLLLGLEAKAHSSQDDQKPSQSLVKNQHGLFAYMWETIEKKRKKTLLKKTHKSINYHFPRATQDNEERSYSQVTGSENKWSQTSKAAPQTVGGG